MKFWNYMECPRCGCSLDFGEKCSCEEAENTVKTIKPLDAVDLDRSEPQIQFRFTVMEKAV